MKKITLLLVLQTSFLYPLTDQDWQVISALKIGGIIGGSLLGFVPGYLVSTALERRIAPAFTPAHWYATKAEGHPALQKAIGGRILKKSIAYLPVPAFMSAGNLLGRATAHKLALLYIARKYGVSIKKAEQALKENLDLDEEE